MTTHYILFYKTVANFVEKRAAFRNEHLDLVRSAHEKGDLVMAGAWADPVDGAMLVFKNDATLAEEFAKNDPYVTNDLVTEWYVRSWSVMIGAE